MSTNKTASKKPATKSAIKTAKAAPKAKTPAKPKQVKAAPLKPELMEVEATESEAIKPEDVEADVVKSERVEEASHNNSMPPEHATSVRFEMACREVSTANRAFLDALKEKADLLGTELKGESVGICDASPELKAVQEQIKFARQGLDILLQERRKLMNVSPEVEAINLKIAGLRKARTLARLKKKSIAAELGI